MKLDGVEKIKYTMLQVKVGEDIIFEDAESSRLVYKVLKSRLSETVETISDENSF